MIIKAYAKINLTLEVVGKKDGFHMLESIVVPINIYDELKFELAKQDQVISNVIIENNNIYDAIDLFKKTFDIKQSVKVTLTKNIPIGYGLGGSSADISATLRGLNKLFKLNKPLSELEELANKLGSDTLFCLYNKRAFIYGRGDNIKFLDSDDKLKFLLIYPKAHLLTKDVFKAYAKTKKNPYINFLEKDFEYTLKNYKNDLLNPAVSLNKELNDIYKKLKEAGLNVSLTGSGSALFIANPTGEEVLKVKDLINDEKMQITKEI